MVMFSVSLCLVAAEFVLKAFGFEPRYCGDPDLDNPVPAPFWGCDEGGMHFVKDRLPADGPWLLSIVNNDGYSDTDEFTPVPEEDTRFRVILLGDSFTWGASAERGYSFADVTERALNGRAPTLLWNTGVPATGTRQALATLRKFGPCMRPHVVVLSFFMNDFVDNLFPLEHMIRRKNHKAMCRYRLDEHLQPVQMSPGDTYAHSLGYSPKDNVSFFEYIFFRSRICTEVARLASEVRTPEDDIDGKSRSDLMQEAKKTAVRKRLAWNKSIKMTEEAMAAIAELTDRLDALLIVMLVPSRDDLAEISKEYREAKRIAEKSGAVLVEPIVVLETNDYCKQPNTHWNNSGHGKAAEVLISCLEPVLESSVSAAARPSK